MVVFDLGIKNHRKSVQELKNLNNHVKECSCKGIQISQEKLLFEDGLSESSFLSLDYIITTDSNFAIIKYMHHIKYIT